VLDTRAKSFAISPLRVTEIVGDIYREAYHLGIAVRKMHQTTVRFGADLWEALEAECARLGVSVAQYLREAALTRLVYAAGRRGDDEFELALELATGMEQEPERPEDAETVATRQQARHDAHEQASYGGFEATAVAAQARLARQRSRQLRGVAQADRSERRSRRD
jgi:hypothetical protein